MTDKRWTNFWFLNGGGIHQAFKYRKWKVLRGLAIDLPKLAWDHQQKEINRLSDIVNDRESHVMDGSRKK